MTEKQSRLEVVDGMPEPLDGQKYEVHVSDMRQFMRCRLAWSWSSPLGRYLEPREPQLFFFFGHIVHDALELFYSGKEPSIMAAVSRSKAFNFERIMSMNTGMWDFETEKYAGAMIQAEDIMYNYALWLKRIAKEGKVYADTNLEYLSMETNWEMPAKTSSGRASTRVYYSGRFDGVVRRLDTGELWLFETKTSQNPKGLKRSLQNDNQATLYLIAANELYDEPVVGVLYNILAKSPPNMPKILKSGKLSCNKQAKTTYDIFLETAINHHEGWSEAQVHDEYSSYLYHLKNKKEPMVERVFIRREPAHLELAAEEFHQIALQMVNPSTPIYASPSALNCGWCKFWSACNARYRGEDTDAYLEADFQPREKWQSISESSGSSVADLEVTRGVMG